MKIQYFGDPSNPKIVVLHPMLLDGKVCCLCWANCGTVIV